MGNPQNSIGNYYGPDIRVKNASIQLGRHGRAEAPDGNLLQGEAPLCSSVEASALWRAGFDDGLLKGFYKGFFRVVGFVWAASALSNRSYGGF